MSASLSIATSGMNASATRLEASASNVANALTNGPVPQTPPNRPVARSDDPRSVYQPVDVVQVSTGSGTMARFTERLPAYELRYQPDAPFADARGMVAAPNVDYAREIADQIASVAAFKANARVFSTASDMARTVIDMKT
ncbi:MAG: flagellar biosynthesis protein FlgC [Salinarimonas sp.]|nr:flagellar biosynthesis protein FlgC [Salinarimonas sp.]